ncbi:hypothetical protein [Sulfitobacter mediterraneus]|uniref:hypothetical protein n=1 Tax=Sulfitobacter mediterraneus TaxID=83219 RepID=UPI0021A9705B|nr:hypothetical protein [Sulfitobacter mediterraneus]UWR13334.1 hypothetical protein K3753_19420 [Sulfitobacter mediterraneus]
MKFRPLRMPGHQGWFGIALIAFISVMIISAIQLPPPQFEPVGARAMAAFVTGCLIVLGLVLVWQDQRAGEHRSEPQGRGVLRQLAAPASLYAILIVYTAMVSAKLAPELYVGLSAIFAGFAGFVVAGRGRWRIAMLALLLGGLLSLAIAWSFITILFVDITG